MALPRLFGMKGYPAPLWKPFWPFLLGAVVTSYTVSSIANAMLESPEYRDSPENPNRRH